MFQMVNDEKPSAEDRKMFWLKVGLGLVAMAVLVGVGCFFVLQK